MNQHGERKRIRNRARVACFTKTPAAGRAAVIVKDVVKEPEYE